MKMFVFFAPNVLSSFYVLLFFFFSPFCSRHVISLLSYTPTDHLNLRIESQRCAPPMSYTCVLVLSLYVPLLWLLFSPPPPPPLPFVHFDDFIAPNVFTIMSAVSYCYSLTERHNHKEKPRDPLTGYFQKLYVDYLVLGSIFIQSIFDFQTKTEEVDFLGIYSRVSRPLEVNRFFLHLYIFLLVSHSLAVWVERLLH
jgi:hypothetical protein